MKYNVAKQRRDDSCLKFYFVVMLLSYLDYQWWETPMVDMPPGSCSRINVTTRPVGKILAITLDLDSTTSSS